MPNERDNATTLPSNGAVKQPANVTPAAGPSQTTAVATSVAPPAARPAAAGERRLRALKVIFAFLIVVFCVSASPAPHAAHAAPEHWLPRATHNSHDRAFALFGSLAVYRLAACGLLWWLGRKVRLTVCLVTLAAGSLIAATSWLLAFSLGVAIGSLVILVSHAIHNADEFENLQDEAAK